MALHLKGEIKIPLGGYTYVTIKRHNKQPTIGILTYKQINTMAGHRVIIPTKSGVKLSSKQFEQLIKNAPLIASTIESLQQSKTKAITLPCNDSAVPVVHTSDTISEPIGKKLVEADNLNNTDENQKLLQTFESHEIICEQQQLIKPKHYRQIKRPRKQYVSIES